MKEIPFTVFTPTYNRAHTLERVYKSLRKQDSSLFEWLIIDDGSNDKTSELVEKFKTYSDFTMVMCVGDKMLYRKVKTLLRSGSSGHPIQGILSFDKLIPLLWINPDISLVFHAAIR